jgi:hypothetical protein
MIITAVYFLRGIFSYVFVQLQTAYSDCFLVCMSLTTRELLIEPSLINIGEFYKKS